MIEAKEIAEVKTNNPLGIQIHTVHTFYNMTVLTTLHFPLDCDIDFLWTRPPVV